MVAVLAGCLTAWAALQVGAAVRSAQQRPAAGRQPEWRPPSITEYKPISRLVVPEHPVRRAKFPVIDIHSHHASPMSEPDLDRIAQAMDCLNLRLLVNLSGGSGERLREGVAVIRKSRHAARMALFANIDFPRDGVGPGFGGRAAAQLERDIEAGALGLKVFKDLGLRVRKTDGGRLRLDDA